MQRFLLILLISFVSQEIFGQLKPLFENDNNKHSECFHKIKILIEKQTDFKFDKHPLEWAQLEIDSNLLRTDTSYNVEGKKRTISYFNKSNTLFLLITSSTDQNNWSKKITVYDNSSNLLLKESYLESGALVFRRRCGYSESSIQFECSYYDTPLYRFNVFSKQGKINHPKIDICQCQF